MLTWICAIYRVVLLAYPGEFRARYGSEMRRVFRESARDVLAEKGSAGLVHYCWRIAIDLVTSAFREQMTWPHARAVLSIRVAMLGGIAFSFGAVWIGIRSGAHGAERTLTFIIPQVVAILGIYGLIVMRVTGSFVRGATGYGIAAGTLLAMFFASITFFRPPTREMTYAMLAFVTAVSASLCLRSRYRAARGGASVFGAIRASGWSSLVASLVNVIACLVLWLFLTPRVSDGDTVYLTRQVLMAGPAIGVAMGIIGGGFAVWKHGAASVPANPAW